MNVLIDGVEYEPIRKPLCTVEGKPVYKGDKLYNSNGVEFIAGKITAYGTGAVVTDDEKIGGLPKGCSWHPKTVMVELLHTDAEVLADSCVTGRISLACRKALDNLKDKS